MKLTGDSTSLHSSSSTLAFIAPFFASQRCRRTDEQVRLGRCRGAEEQLTERGEDYVVGRARYAQNSRGTIVGDRQGFLKLLFARADMKLVGVHVLGELATEIVHTGLMTMICGGGAAELNEACFNVPTLSELYKSATYRALLARDTPWGVPANA